MEGFCKNYDPLFVNGTQEDDSAKGMGRADDWWCNYEDYIEFSKQRSGILPQNIPELSEKLTPVQFEKIQDTLRTPMPNRT